MFESTFEQISSAFEQILVLLFVQKHLGLFKSAFEQRLNKYLCFWTIKSTQIWWQNLLKISFDQILLLLIVRNNAYLFKSTFEQSQVLLNKDWTNISVFEQIKVLKFVQKPLRFVQKCFWTNFSTLDCFKTLLFVQSFFKRIVQQISSFGQN